MKSIKYIIGYATKPEIGCSGIHIIAHCCNDIGQFGAGFVVPLERRYMGLKQAYKSYIQNTNQLSVKYKFNSIWLILFGLVL